MELWALKQTRASFCQLLARQRSLGEVEAGGMRNFGVDGVEGKYDPHRFPNLILILILRLIPIPFLILKSGKRRIWPGAWRGTVRLGGPQRTKSWKSGLDGWRVTNDEFARYRRH